MQREFVASSSRRAAQRTYFAVLSPDLLLEITLLVLNSSRTEREKQSLPALLLPEDSPLPAVLSKVFRVLELSSSSSPACPSFIGTAGNVGLNLAQDVKCQGKILCEFLPHVRLLRICTDGFKDGRVVNSFCRSMVSKCVHVAALDIKVGVLPHGSPVFALRVVTAIGGKLTSLSVNNYSYMKAFPHRLVPLVNSIAKNCARLARFEFRGHQADVLTPIYDALGASLLEVEINVLSPVNWHVTLGCLQRNCRRLRSVHLDSGIMVVGRSPELKNLLAPSGPLTDLLMSYGSQLVSASVTLVSLAHIPLLLSACPSVRVAVTYGERWNNNSQRMGHLAALGSRVRVLCLDGLEDAYCELLANSVSSCDRIETILIEDIHSNVGVRALFSTKHTRLRRLCLSLNNEKLDAAAVKSLANSTRKLRELELQLNHSGGSYSNELYRIAKSNNRLERFALTEYGPRNLESAISLVNSILHFVESAANLQRIDITLEPSKRPGDMKWNDEIATLLLPYRRAKVSGSILYNHRYEF